MSTDTHPGPTTLHCDQVSKLAFAELHAGQPKAATRWLAEVDGHPQPDPARSHLQVLGQWARHLDTNSYPGDVTGDLSLSGTLPQNAQLTSTTVTLIKLTVAVGSTPTPRGNPRSPCPNVQAAAALSLHTAVGGLQRIVAHGVRSDEPAISLWAHLAQAEVAYRGGMGSLAHAALRTMKQQAARLNSPLALVLAHCKEGDWSATPPELMGSPSGATDASRLRSAIASYRQAEDVLADLDSSGLRAALALRHANVAWLTKDYDTQRHHLQLAHHHASTANANAFMKLVQVHQLLNGIASGDTAILYPRSVLEVTSNDLRVWAGRDGSSSWTRGLADLAKSVALRWAQQSKPHASEAARDLSHALLATPPDAKGVHRGTVR